MITAKTTDESRKPTMSTIPTRVTQEQFETHILPYLSTAQRGYASKTPLRQIFNLMLSRLHTGCQWKELPVSKGARNRKKASELAGGLSSLS
jgi:transposase